MKFARRVLREDARRQGKLPGERTLRLVMASLVAMQSFAPLVAAAEAPVVSQITRVDETSVNFNNGVADVYAEKVQGNLGINRFTDFSVAEKNTANMYFKEQGGSAEATDLVNFVSNRIDIAGTVNALRENEVGGHLLFVSPEGMVVTSTGVINAGSLTMATPTEDYFEKMKLDPKATGEKAEIVNIFSSELTDAQLTKLMTNYTADTMVPATLALNADGSIAIAGQINVKTAATLMAGTVNVGDTGVVRNAMDFSQISNLSKADQEALSDADRLTLTADESGNIVLRGMTETTVDGKVDAGNGAAIVKAENEVTVDLTAEDAEKAGLVNFDAAASTATVTVNGSVKGASVDVSAKATATFKGNIVNKPAEKKEGESSADDKAKTEKIAEGAKKTGALKKISDTAKNSSIKRMCSWMRAWPVRPLSSDKTRKWNRRRGIRASKRRVRSRMICRSRFSRP